MRRLRQPAARSANNVKRLHCHRLLVAIVLVVGVVICLVNALYLLPFLAMVVDNNNNDNDNQQQQQQLVHVGHWSLHNHHNHTSTTDITTTTAYTAFNTTGKEKLLQILHEAGILFNTSTDTNHNNNDNMDMMLPSLLDQLPTWQDVVDLYGDRPKIVGLETCQSFNTQVPASERLLAPAGVFNSGTNLLAELLLKNCVLTERQRMGQRQQQQQQQHNRNHTARAAGTGIRWQVNWGKHTPPRFRLQHAIDKTIRNNAYIMPVVLVRDPYSWMQSMCRHRYSAHWFHPPHHCPNLIPNEEDFDFLSIAPHYKWKRFYKHHRNDPWLVDNVMNVAGFQPNSTVVPLYVRYKLTNTTHASLAHLWNDWYDEYLSAASVPTLKGGAHGGDVNDKGNRPSGDGFPRLLVRMEDLIFHAPTVIEKVCKCVGGTPSDRSSFQYIIDSAKNGAIHGNDKTTLVDAMIRYGSAAKLNRTRGMTQEDIAYAKQVFRQDLMDMFGYSHPT